MGKILKLGAAAPQSPDEAVSRLRAFARGELSWAEVEGMTWEEAQSIAQVGCELANAGRLEEARVLFEGLVAGNPKDSSSRAALGTVYQKLGMTQQALEEYSAALQEDPANPVALSNRGELRLKSGDSDGYADLARAVEADPNGSTAAGRRAQALVKAVTLMALEQSKAANG